MFDTTKDFTVKIMSGGEKQATLRYPTDAQWSDRAKRNKIVNRILGRNKTRREVSETEAVDRELFVAIAQNGAVDKFDEFECAAAIVRLSKADVVDVAREGDGFRITLAVFGGAKVVHVLRMPTRKEAKAFSVAAVHVTNSPRAQELRVSLEPTAAFWEKLRISVDGYAEGSAIPIVHKDAAIVEVLDQIAALEDEVDPED